MRSYQGKHKPIGFEPPRRVLDEGKEQAEMIDCINVSTESERTPGLGSETSSASALYSTTEDEETNSDLTAGMQSLTAQGNTGEPAFTHIQDSVSLGTNYSVDESVQVYTASPFNLFPDLPQGPGFNGEVAFGDFETDESFLELQHGEDTVMEDFNLESSDMSETSLELEYLLSWREEQLRAGA
ncbi:hypothetical protein FGRMN_4406 [Fusarium graminum]|nr:hypothetical protein FGRMN_4406 [Fusarium graminum]